MPEHTVEELKQAQRVADRLLGRPPLYRYGRAVHGLEVGDMVELDKDGNFQKFQRNSPVVGVAINKIECFNYGYIIQWNR